MTSDTWGLDRDVANATQPPEAGAFGLGVEDGIDDAAVAHEAERDDVRQASGVGGGQVAHGDAIEQVDLAVVENRAAVAGWHVNPAAG